MTTGKFGVNMWWHVPGCVIDGELARGAMKAAGFDGMLPEPTRHAEVSRATRSVAGRRRRSDKSIAEKVGDDSSNLVYGILDFDQDGEQAEYQQNTTVRMDKASGAVVCEGAKADRVMAAVQAYEGKVTDEDVRQFLVNVVSKCHGIPKRQGGGIYFIPAQYVERVEAAVQKVAEKMVQIQQGTAASVVKAVGVAKAAKEEREEKDMEKAESKADRIPVVDAAVAVLTKAGKALTSREVYEQAVREGWYVSDASDPYTSFVSVLSKAVAKGDKRIQRIGTGVWGVAA